MGKRLRRGIYTDSLDTESYGRGQGSKLEVGVICMMSPATAIWMVIWQEYN